MNNFDRAAMPEMSVVEKIWPQLEAHVVETIATTLSIEVMISRLSGDLAELGGLANAAPVAEGRLLEQAIATIARCNPSCLVLTGLRLPIPDAAWSRVTANKGVAGTVPVLDADGSSRRSYMPDIVVLEAKRRFGQLIDIKRSLASYDPLRRDDLRYKLLASAQVLPDLAWREHNIAIDEVHVAIIEGSGSAVDPARGIGSFADLDGMLRVPGAAQAIQRVRALFAERVKANFDAARRATVERELRHRSETDISRDHSFRPEETFVSFASLIPHDRISLAKTMRPRQVRIGFAALRQA